MFVYSCNVKMHALEFDKCLESIFFLLLVVEAVSLQKLVKLLKEVIGWLARDQVNMVDEAKLCSPVCSTFEALCCGEELGPFC